MTVDLFLQWTAQAEDSCILIQFIEFRVDIYKYIFDFFFIQSLLLHENHF